MERRRGALPVGTNEPNSVPNYANLQAHTSFGSTHSTDSNDSFRTQIPLPYHLSQDYQQNNSYSVGGGFGPYPQTGSTGSSKSLNPHSSPYIPQGNTPVLPSAGFTAQGWGAPFMVDSCIASMTSYQQLPSGQSSVTQYQGANQYQPEGDAQFGGAVGGLNPQLQNALGNGVGPYGGHFGADGVALNNSNPYNTANGQVGFTTYATPDLAYAAVGSNQSFSMPYPIGVVNQPANQMYNGSANNMYNSQMPGSWSFSSASTNSCNGQNEVASCFNSAPGNIYNNWNSAPNFKSASQYHKSSRPSASFTNTSTMRFQKKSLATSNGTEQQNSYRGNTNKRSSSSSTSSLGGPVQVPKGARVLSPEQEISNSRTPESFRTRITKVGEDTSAAPTPVSKPYLSNTDLTSTRLTETKTPQLRSRRGQTIVSATEPTRNQSVSDWTIGVRRSSEIGATNSEELKDRGSPFNALSLMALNDADPFMSSAVVSSPFDCMTPCRFTVGFSAGPLSQELLTLTQGGTRNPTLPEALDSCNVPFSEYCRQAKPDNYGVIKIKNVGILVLTQQSILLITLDSILNKSFRGPCLPRSQRQNRQ
jgi:hypothetical protein